MAQQLDVGHQRLANQNKTLSDTSGYTVEGVDMPVDGLSIKYFNYEHKLDAENIWNAPGLSLEGSLHKKVCINSDNAALMVSLIDLLSDWELPRLSDFCYRYAQRDLSPSK